MSKKVYWTCVVGAKVDSKLESGADSPMRKAVGKAFKKTTGHYPEIMWSGWGTTKERVEILNAVGSMEKDDPILLALVAMLRK
jgi:hypothetical protein